MGKGRHEPRRTDTTETGRHRASQAHVEEVKHEILPLGPRRIRLSPPPALFRDHRSTPMGEGPRRRHQDANGVRWRSEEHTSELQSQSNLVCRLLLEKK